VEDEDSSFGSAPFPRHSIGLRANNIGKDGKMVTAEGHGSVRRNTAPPKGVMKPQSTLVIEATKNAGSSFKHKIEIKCP